MTTAFRTAEIARAFEPWLKRKSPPLHLSKDLTLVAAERDALIATLVRFAPHAENPPHPGPGAWTIQVLDRLDATMKTRSWPTVGEMSEACQALQIITEATPKADDQIDPYAVMAKKMGRGEAVPEGYVFGPKAKEMIARGLVSQTERDAYRDGHRQNLLRVYRQPETVDAIMAKLDADHAAADRAEPPRRRSGPVVDMGAYR